MKNPKECRCEVEVEIHYGLVACVMFDLTYDVEPYDPGDWTTPPCGGGVCDVDWGPGVITMICDTIGQDIAFSLNEKERSAIMKIAERKLDKMAIDFCDSHLRDNQDFPKCHCSYGKHQI